MTEARGAIHDLGYKRYVGTRRSAGTRWQVIARHEIGNGWKTWWRFKIAIGFAVIVTFVWAGYIYSSSTLGSRLKMLGGSLLSMSDAALPLSIEWYCRVAFYVSLTVGAAAIAGDVQTGAFTFYFARSVRPRDYVAGKLVGIAALVGAIAVLGPLALALIRLGIYESLDDALEHLAIVPRMVLVGVIATLAYSAVPLAFSALVPNRRTALALWAAYYLVLGRIWWELGSTADGRFAMLDLLAAVRTVGNDVLGVEVARGSGAKWGNPVGAAWASLAIHVGGAIAIVWWRIRRAQTSGVGGSG